MSDQESKTKQSYRRVSPPSPPRRSQQQQQQQQQQSFQPLPRPPTPTPPPPPPPSKDSFPSRTSWYETPEMRGGGSMIRSDGGWGAVDTGSSGKGGWGGGGGPRRDWDDRGRDAFAKPSASSAARPFLPPTAPSSASSSSRFDQPSSSSSPTKISDLDRRREERLRAMGEHPGNTTSREWERVRPERAVEPLTSGGEGPVDGGWAGMRRGRGRGGPGYGFGGRGGGGGGGGFGRGGGDGNWNGGGRGGDGGGFDSTRQMAPHNPPPRLPRPPLLPPSAPQNSSFPSSATATSFSHSHGKYPPPQSPPRPQPLQKPRVFSFPTEPPGNNTRRDSGYSSISNSGGWEKGVEKEDDGGWGGELVESKRSESRVRSPSRDARADEDSGRRRIDRRMSRSRSRSPRRRVSPDLSRHPRARSPHQNQRDDDHRYPAQPRSPPPHLVKAQPSRNTYSASSSAGSSGRGMRSSWDDESTGPSIRSMETGERSPPSHSSTGRDGQRLAGVRGFELRTSILTPSLPSSIARSPSQCSSYSTQVPRQRESTSPLLLSASQSVDLEFNPGRRIERTPSIDATSTTRGRSKTAESFGEDRWRVEEEKEKDPGREGGGFVDLTGSPSPPLAIPDPSRKRSWTAVTSTFSPPPTQSIDAAFEFQEETEPSPSKFGRVSSPTKSEQAGPSKKSSRDDGGLSDEQKRALLENEQKYIQLMLPKSKMKSAKRHLNDRLAELSRCLDHNSDDKDAVLEPSSRPYALLTHIPELTDKFGTFARPPSGRNAVNFKAGRKKTSRKRVVEDLGDSDEAEMEEEEPKPERKKPKTRHSSRKEITADEEEPAAPSTSSKRKPRLGGTPSDASELDDQPPTSSLLTPRPVKEQQQDPSTSTMNGRTLRKKGEVVVKPPPRKRASLFTGKTASSTAATTKRTKSLASLGSLRSMSGDKKRVDSSEEEGGKGSKGGRETTTRNRSRRESPKGGEEGEGDGSLFGSDE